MHFQVQARKTQMQTARLPRRCLADVLKCNFTIWIKPKWHAHAMLAMSALEFWYQCVISDFDHKEYAKPNRTEPNKHMFDPLVETTGPNECGPLCVIVYALQTQTN